VTANSFAALLRVRRAPRLLDLDSASLKASERVSATESREASVSLGLTQQQIDRSNFDCHDQLACSSLYCRVAADQQMAVPVRHRCAHRRALLLSNYLSATRAL
jgi:hypothetical protein